jgi:hypothetical protein
MIPNPETVRFGAEYNPTKEHVITAGAGIFPSR